MNKSNIKAFNIRVYGLFINKKTEILLADEERFNMRMTKFPGGGVQFGEGTIDCLKREALEELGQEIEIIRHFYTTDFFQRSAFNEEHQLISIYYLARFTGKEKFKVSEKMFDFTGLKKEIISFRYKPIEDMREEDLSFPADKVVLGLLRKGE
jgi:8-oxo-dGTP diphosphatase